MSPLKLFFVKVLPFTVSLFMDSQSPLSMTPVSNLPPVSLIPVAICHLRRWQRRQICRQYRSHRWQICHRLQQHKWNWWQICHRCRWHRWCNLTCEYLCEFSKKFEMNLMLFPGAWGKVIHEKNLKQKISCHCPFKRLSNKTNYKK